MKITTNASLQLPKYLFVLNLYKQILYMYLFLLKIVTWRLGLRRRHWYLKHLITSTPGSWAPTICGREAWRSRVDSFTRFIFFVTMCVSYCSD